VSAVALASGIIAGLPREMLKTALFQIFRQFVLCTKHPAFKEEREWRIIYSPTVELSPAIVEDYASVRGIPQTIYKLPLKHAPEQGLNHADVPSIINRIIVGPSTQPFTIWQATVKLLLRAGVENAKDRVFNADIPLRIN
jgi:hypothetical protein